MGCVWRSACRRPPTSELLCEWIHKCRPARRTPRPPLASETADKGSINPHGSMTTAPAECAPFSRYCGHDSPKIPAPQPCVRTLRDVTQTLPNWRTLSSPGAQRVPAQIRDAGEDLPISDLAVYSMQHRVHPCPNGWLQRDAQNLARRLSAARSRPASQVLKRYSGRSLLGSIPLGLVNSNPRLATLAPKATPRSNADASVGPPGGHARE